MRHGMLGKELAARGHQVTQWAATFNHFTKKQRADRDQLIQWSENYEIQLLHGSGYQRHIGWRRMAFHRQMAEAFRANAAKKQRPDIILTSLPTLEVSSKAVAFGRTHNVPVMLDVRDLWPDAVYQALPRPMTPLLRTAARPFERKLKQVCHAADGILAVSESYLQWATEHAGRRTGGQDRVFPLGYEQTSIQDSQRVAAERFWESYGVKRDGSFRCCFFGTLGSSTDLRPVFDAAAAYQAADCQAAGSDKVQFVICGAGPKWEKSNATARALKNVIMPGWVTPEQIRVLMELSDVGIAPYGARASQSLPNKPIEYLSSALPVVSSLRGEMETLLSKQRCGLTYDPTEKQHLYRRLEELRAQPTYHAEMRTNARQLFAREFAADKVYPAMAEHLELVAGIRRAVPTLAA